MENFPLAEHLLPPMKLEWFTWASPILLAHHVLYNLAYIRIVGISLIYWMASRGSKNTGRHIFMWQPIPILNALITLCSKQISCETKTFSKN